MAFSEIEKKNHLVRLVEATRRLAVGKRSFRLTHFISADDLTRVKPDEPDLDLVFQRETTRACAIALLSQGVEVKLQIIEAEAYLKWLGDRPNTAAARAAYRDPARMLQGKAVLDELSLPEEFLATAVPQRRGRAKTGRASTPADKLIHAWRSGDLDTFGDLAEGLIERGEMGVLDAACRKVSQSHDEEDLADFAHELMAVAEMVGLPAGGEQASLVVMPVAVASGEAPDPAALGASMWHAGVFGAASEVRFAGTWCALDALRRLNPIEVRALVRDVLDGRELDPGLKAPDQGEGGPLRFRAMIGIERRAWEDEPDPEDRMDTAEDEMERTGEAFTKWAASLPKSEPRLLAAVQPDYFSNLAETVADLLERVLEDPEASWGAIDDFVRGVQEEIGAAVPIRLNVKFDAIGAILIIASAEGRGVVDTMRFDREEIPAPAAEIASLLSNRYGAEVELDASVRSDRVH